MMLKWSMLTGTGWMGSVGFPWTLRSGNTLFLSCRHTNWTESLLACALEAQIMAGNVDGPIWIVSQNDPLNWFGERRKHQLKGTHLRYLATHFYFCSMAAMAGAWDPKNDGPSHSKLFACWRGTKAGKMMSIFLISWFAMWFPKLSKWILERWTEASTMHLGARFCAGSLEASSRPFGERFFMFRLCHGFEECLQYSLMGNGDPPTNEGLTRGFIYKWRIFPCQ